MTISLCAKMGTNISQPTGAVCSDINIQEIGDIPTTLSLTNGSYYYIVDTNGNFLYHSDRGFLKSQVSITQAEFSLEWPPKTEVDTEEAVTYNRTILPIAMNDTITLGTYYKQG